MPPDLFFLSDSESLRLLSGQYDKALVALSVFVAVLAGIMAFQLAGMARAGAPRTSRQVSLFSGAFVLGAGVWSMHFIGMLAYSVCSTVRYDPLITLLSMLPGFLASWVALGLLARERVTPWQLAVSGVAVGAGIGVMHYSGMAAVHESLVLRFDPVMFALSIVLAVALSILALWLRSGLTANRRFGPNAVKLLSGVVLGIAISAMHYTGMEAARFLPGPGSARAPVSNVYLALAIAGTTILAILVTGGVNALLRHRSIYQRMALNEARTRTIVETAVDGIITLDSRGIIRAFNGAAEAIFGWQAAEVIGHNIKMLMPEPEPEHSRHDNDLQLNLDSGLDRIIGSGREVTGLRKDGSTLPLRLALGKATLNNETLFVGFVTDLTDSKRRNAEFEGVVNAISRSLAVIEFELDGTIRHANPNFLEITGYSLDELVGRHHSVLCTTSEVASGSYRQLWDTLRQGGYASGDFHRIGKGGKEVWIHGSYNPILDPDGRPYKIIKFASDLSERHAMEQDLRDAKARAEQAAAAKSTFLANMSHEIRTPMNAIIGFTDVLLGEPASDTQRRHLTTVRNSARNLLLLLNDILDTAKLERGAIELEIHDFSLREVCMQALASLRVNAQAKGLPLVLDYPDQEPEFFKGDALRIQQILLNLVGNAVKFTDRGQVTLSVSHHQDMLHLVVRDTGIGIPADRIARIFEPFSQADASMSRRFGGTGLGTTIARQFIELMHGRIRVDSQVGVGSTFHVELPLPPGEAVAATQEQAVIDLPPLRLLVADDVPQNLELLQLMLGRLGHTLVTASHGEEAVQAFAGGRFDVVLMDVQMPVLNGLDASRQIRRLEAESGRPPTPIIALTASVLEEDADAARQAGMDGFASKPVDMPQLSLEIARVLGLQASPAGAARQRAMPGVRGSVIDWVRGQQLWGSEHAHRKALGGFLAEFGHCVPQLRLQLDTPAELAARVHRLRGAAGNLALSRVASLGATIEQSLAGNSPQETLALLDRLADELINVTETLGVLPAGAPAAAAPATAVDTARLLPLLQELDTALSHGELPETLLVTLEHLLPESCRHPLEQAIDSFDFDTARAALASLQTRYQKDPSAA
ncbi:PAS domain S-box protein [Zoogloea sp.]|uniref:PAS domain S-box protein n=1 Tax=Zoogloea sp. TaxID=49181 RepID=UPI0014162997|nr:MAG: PAS domain S-box protein [Zoogloea sp.]